jgi:hypothetical protein
MSIYDGFEIFKHLSVQTKYMILYERSEIKSYKKGEIICHMDHRSPWNFKYASWYSEYKAMLSSLRDHNMVGVFH